MINNISQRNTDRYRYAPVYFDNIELKYKDGYALEVGDVVPFGGTDTQFTDLQSGARNLPEQLYEVLNKSLNIRNGNIKVNLLSTNFQLNARYGVFSCASNINAGSTSTTLRLKITNDTGEFAREVQKWAPFVGERIRVRSTDYTVDEITTIKELSTTDNTALILDPALSFTPLEDYIAEIPDYEDSSSDIDASYKLQFAHMTAQVKITSVTDNKTFDVDDATKLLEGSEVYVHSKDYTRDSFDDDSYTIDSIVGNTITLDKALSFTPVINDLVDRSAFLDSGDPYLLI
jgi:hypothetical protein